MNHLQCISGKNNSFPIFQERHEYDAGIVSDTKSTTHQIYFSYKFKNKFELKECESLLLIIFNFLKTYL